jgi:hypothetical protein
MMKKSVLTIIISLGLALPAAVASADPVLEGYQRDIERALSTTHMPVNAEREISYVDFFESDPVKASYYRDLYRMNPLTDQGIMEAKREGSYSEFL